MRIKNTKSHFRSLYSNKIAKWPTYNKKELEAVKNVLISGKGNYWTGNETKSFEKNDTNPLDNKQTLANPNNKEFLNLLESSWGEKFSRIIKNSVNNGVNKVEIELKPQNLGKLNL